MNKKKILTLSISAALASGIGIGIATASESVVAIVFNKPTVEYIIASSLSPDNDSNATFIPPSPKLSKMYNAVNYKFAMDEDGNLWKAGGGEDWIKTEHTGVTDISVSHGHALMIKSGVVYSIGENRYGQLGDGTTTDSTLNWVNTGFSGASSVGAINDGHYGMSFAIKNGEVYSVGNNSHENLGRSSTDSCGGRDCSLSWQKTSLVATNIETLLTGGHRVIVQGSDSKIYTTDNNYGWIEDPTTGITNITSGSYHAYGIKNGTVYAYGINAGLFDTAALYYEDLTEFKATSLSNVKDVAISIGSISDGSSTASGYALTNSGELYVIGQNENNKFGLDDESAQENWIATGLTNVDSLMNSGGKVYLKMPDGHYYYFSLSARNGLSLSNGDDIGEYENLQRVNFVIDSDGDGVSDNAEVIAGTDPDDSNEYLSRLIHPVSDQTVNITENTVYYDSGDFIGNYGENESSELTIIPPEGKAINFKFSEISITDAYLSISEGGNSNREIVDCGEEITCEGGVYQSYADDGSVIVYFESYDDLDMGWSAILELVDQSTLDLSDNDGDGLVDIVDSDDDNDGVSDEREIEEGSDPFDASDFFADRDIIQSMAVTGKDISNLNTSRIEDFSYMLATSKVGNVSIPDISGWDVSNGTNFEGMFSGNINFNADLSGWNVSNGTNFSDMFNNNFYFSSDLSEWNVSNGTDFSGMFQGTANFNSDLSKWKVNNGINFSRMFYVSNIFNKDLKDWKVDNGTDFSYMFGATKEFNQDISGWNVSNGTNFNAMFSNSAMSTSIRKWSAPNVESANWMISSSGLTTADIPYELGGDVDQTDTDSDGFIDFLEVKEGSDPNDAGSIPSVVYHPDTHLGVKTFNITEAVTYYDNGGAFENYIPQYNGDMIFVPPTGYAVKAEVKSIKFYGGTDELQIIEGSDPSDLASAYERCTNNVCDNKKIVSLAPSGAMSFRSTMLSPSAYDGWEIKMTLVKQEDMDNRDTDGDGILNVNDEDDDNDFISDAQELIDGTDPLDNTDFNLVVANDRSELNVLISTGMNLAIIDTSKVEDFSGLFYRSSKSLEGIENWDVSSGKDFSSMFERTTNFNRDISGWKTSSATNMAKMFYFSGAFKQDISGWDVSNVTISYSFRSYSQLPSDNSPF